MTHTTAITTAQLFGAALASTLFSNASASIAAIEFGFIDGTPPLVRNQTVGWQFDVNESIMVDRLAFFDQGGDGLLDAHQVGIWNPDGSLAISALIPSGTDAGIDGGWRYVDVTSFELAVGDGYIIGAETFLGSDVFFGSDAELTSVIPQIDYVTAKFAPLGDGFVRPELSSAANTGFFGPNFFVVPTPAGLSVLVLGGLVGTRRTR